MQALSINNNEFVFGGKEGKMRNTFHFPFAIVKHQKQNSILPKIG